MRKSQQGSQCPSYMSRSSLYVCLTPDFFLLISKLTWNFKAEEVLTPEDIDNVRKSYKSHLEAELAKVPGYLPSASMLQEQWSGIVWPVNKEAEHDPITGLDRSILQQVGRASVAVPEGFVSPFVFYMTHVFTHCCLTFRKFILSCNDTSRIGYRVLSLVKVLTSPLPRYYESPLYR